MKWNVHNILEFLNVYQQYPSLWNIKNKDYCNIKLKAKTFQILYNELNGKQLIGAMDIKQLKAKIKSIKDVYRQELHKIEKSKKTGCGTEEVYSPKLAWFKEASYLGLVLATRKSEINLDLTPNSEKAEPDEGNETVVSTNDNSCSKEDSKKKLLPKERPPPVKRFKKRLESEETPSEISVAIHSLDKTAQNVGEEKPYDQFGKFVAAELRQLPQRQAILLQQEIQNCIIRSKLSSLEHTIYSSSQEICDIVFSPCSSDH